MEKIKNLLIILLIFPLISLAQKTYVPDDIFETYLEANGMGDGILLNDSVATDSINSVQHINISGLSISNIIGIEDFINLQNLACSSNQIDSINLTNNTLLRVLTCHNNNITELYVSSNLLLEHLDCGSNQLTTLDVSQNTALNSLNCHYNNISTLDLTNLSTNIINLNLHTYGNFNLFCISSSFNTSSC